VDFATHRRGNILDLILTNSPDRVLSLTDEGCIGRSDHNMLLLKIESNVRVKLKKSPIVCWKKGKYNEIREKLSSINWRTKLADKNTEEAWQTFKQEVDKLVKENIPTFMPTGKQRPKWLTPEIRGLLTRKKKAWKTAKSNPTTLNWSEYTAAEKLLKKSITRAKRKLERELAYDKNGNGNQFRKYIKQRTRTRDPVGPIIDNGVSLTEDAEIAESLNNFFASIFTREDKSNIPTKEMETDARLERIQVSRADVMRKLRKLRADSAAGPDGIHPKILVECAAEISEPLAEIYIKSLRESVIPADWKTATVTPIFKKGKRSDPGNYRPVSLTSVPCKVLESIIKDNVMQHLLSNKLLKDSQHGFMPNRSCTTNLIEFMEPVTRNVDKGRPVDIFYLDFSKAFDSVPHERLLVKLAAKGVAGEVGDWLRAWLTGRTQKVRVGDELSSEKDVESGVPQGTVMGPCLFDVYIDDIDDVAALLELLSKFADDCKGQKTILSEKDRQDLQMTIDKLHEWAIMWGMSFNKDKCKVMHVGHNNPQYDYFMQGTKLSVIEEEKDVGVIIHNSLKPARQCQRAAACGYSVLQQLRKNFHFRDRHVFVNLYKQYVRPHLEFATPVWSPWQNADKQVLENVQRKFVKMIAGLPPGTYEAQCKELGLETLEERRKVQDLAQAHKMIRGKEKLQRIPLFNHVDGGRTRQDADELNIKQDQARLEVRKNFFTQRIVKEWNAVPREIKRAATVTGFKSAYRNQNRTEPGGTPDES
jgi:Reverse transcriptase (RNA-dependent DNA polymerase)